jgi:hypothetical protein
MHTLLLHASGAIVRLVRVLSCENYWREYEAAYGNTQSPNRDWKVYVNCEQWYERLLSDLKFKRFPKMTLDECSKGVWRVNNFNSENYQALHTYLLKQIKLYNDDEPVVSVMERLKEDSFDPVDNIIDEHGILQGFAFSKIVYRDEGWVIPSWSEWKGMIYRVLTHMEWKYGICFYEKIPITSEASDMSIVLCDKTGNIHINQETILLEYIPEFLYKLYECIAPDQETFMEFLKQLYVSKGFVFYATTCIEGTSENTVVGVESSCGLAYAFLENEKRGMHTSCIWESVGPDIISETKPKVDQKLYVYQSVIDHTKCLCWTEPMQDLVDFKLITKPICETEFGFELFNKLNECTFDRFEMIYSDLESLKNTICALKLTPSSYKNDKQYIYTQRYVNYCKDNTAETQANTVIASLFEILQKCIPENNINRNRIGQDLIVLGVQKTRKSRGFVYGLREPDPSILPLIMSENLPLLKIDSSM